MIVKRVYRQPPRITKRIYKPPVLGQKLPFEYKSEKDIWRLIRSRSYARLVRLYMELQHIIIQNYKGKLRDRRISRKTKKQTGRKMTIKQARAINRGRSKAGLKRIDFKVLK
tara:strand:- start:258 stop:593 length:336 start_codon:yes stop_codon:yes gene_type:complete